MNKDKFINYILLFMQVLALVCSILALLFPQSCRQTVVYLVMVLGYGCGVALSIRMLTKRKD